MRKDIIFGDIHAPFEDKETVRVFFDYLQAFKPNVSYCIGDLVDFYNVSSFSKDSSRGLNFQDELTYIKDVILTRWAKIKGQKIYLQGNHELRLQNYIYRNCRELGTLKALRLDKLLELDKFGIKYISSGRKDCWVVTPYNIAIGHFNKVNKHAGYTAKNLRTDKGVSIVQAHTHRQGYCPFTNMAGIIVDGIECGCLCDYEQSYVKDANWQQGFVEVYYDGNEYFPVLRTIRNNKFIGKGGKVWK